MTALPIIDIKNICKSFSQGRNKKTLVLDTINTSLFPGEIVAILGRSGSGKSTLLRTIAGLIAPSSGDIMYHDTSIHCPMPGITMIFQHFALLPWLTVLENVELGLEAQGVKKEARRQRALHAIDIVGLDGFESAYPKELSGGMSQRVGFARALVVDPEVLLMDEPFSALDVLTAENLRGDLIDLWQSTQTNIKSIVIVTHNIEEAVFLADRILIFSHNPGSIAADLHITMPHPRSNQDPRFCKWVDEVYTYITNPEKARNHDPSQMIAITYRLPKTEVSSITGLIEALISPEYTDKVDLPDLAENLHLTIDDLFPIIEALEILHLARVCEGDIELSIAGKQLAEGDILQRKEIFARQLLQHIPLAVHICQKLKKRNDHEAHLDLFIDELKEQLDKETAQAIMTTLIDWSRYAEVFSYDYNTQILSLENPE